MNRNTGFFSTRRAAAPLAALAAFVLFAALAAFLALRPAPAGGQEPAAPPAQPAVKQEQNGARIAVVDLEAIRKEYKKFIDRDVSIGERQKQLEEKLAAMRKEVDETKRKRDLCPEKSAEWWEFDRKMNKAAAELESAVKEATDQINRLDLQLWEEIVGDITSAISKFSKENGVKIVFWKKEILLDRATIAERAASLELISVVYADASLDITKQVTDALNQAYAKQKTPNE